MNNLIFGTVNDDVLQGTVWSDVISGNSGNDVLYGGLGRDILYGGVGNDTLFGGEGNDDLNDGSGNDKLYGQNGDDYLRAGEGDDLLDGGTGRDFLEGGLGSNQLYGGSGDDADYYFVREGKNTIFDADDAQSTDTVELNIDYLTAANTERVGLDLHIIGENDPNYITIVKDYFNHTSLAYRKNFITNQYSQDATLENLQRILHFDYWQGTAAADVIRASNLADQILADAGNDVVYGYLGSDVINGKEGNDTLYGGLGHDTLYGDDGNDTLMGEAGDDYLYGGVGSDTYIVSAGSGEDKISDLDEPLITNTIRFININSTQIAFSRVGAALGVRGYGSVTDGIFIVDYFDDVNSNCNYKFVFSDKTITLSDMQTGKYRFSLNGTAAAETIHGSKFADAIYGFNGNDMLYAHDGNDVLQGGLGNDSLFGHAGNDGLNGNEGNDVLGGGAGDDVLYGGSSNDTDIYLFQTGAGKDVVIDTDDTTATDSLRFSTINSATATFSKSGKDLIVKYGAGSDQVTVKQFYDTSVKAGRKQFQFADKTITAAQVPALLQQAQALKIAAAGWESAEPALSVNPPINPPVSLAAAT